MLARVPRWPFSLDPLIAEAKQRARRRRWLGLLALVVVGAAVFATLELRSASGSGPAAVRGRPVVHVVMEDPPSTVSFDLKTGRKTVRTLGEEMWLYRQNTEHHIISTKNRVISTEGGRRVADDVWTGHLAATTEAAAVGNLYASLATDLHAALETGKAQLVGRGSFDGHRLYWLRVRQTALPQWRHNQPWPQASEAVGVDARSYKPILLRFASGKRYSYTRILSAKAIAYSAVDFKSHGPRQRPPYPGKLAPGFGFGSANPSAPHSTVVREPWLTAGTTVAGLKLRAVRPFTIRRSKHHFSYGAPNPKAIRGLELVYGPASHEPASLLPTRINLYGPQWESGASTPFTTVYEVPRAAHVPPWSAVPADSIQVQTGWTTLGNRVVDTLSTGYLKERGLYITIRTPQGPHTALQIARSLRTGQARP